MSDDSVTKRKISWAQFYKLRPDLKPAANDNTAEEREPEQQAKAA
jgi:hypothetical protein